MNADPRIIAWLRRRRREQTISSIVMGLLIAVLGVAVLFLTFWFAYAIAWIGEEGFAAAVALFSDAHLHLGHVGRMWLSGGFLVLLISSYLRTDRFSFWDYPKEEYSPAVRTAGLFALLAYPQASSRMITDILFTGPRMVHGGFRLFGEGVRTGELDPETGAAVLGLIAARSGPVSNQEIVKTVEGAELGRLTRQLAGIEGVVVLPHDLSATDELRTELRALLL
jgi:hypothetical protein